MARRFLGIDFGQRRIGLAVADEGLKVARPLRVLEVWDDASRLSQLRQVIEGERVTDLILGLPRGLDGQETSQTQTVRHFAKELGALELPLTLQDEAGTSEGVSDDGAAVRILQDYLESHV